MNLAWGITYINFSARTESHTDFPRSKKEKEFARKLYEKYQESSMESRFDSTVFVLWTIYIMMKKGTVEHFYWFWGFKIENDC